MPRISVAPFVGTILFQTTALEFGLCFRWKSFCLSTTWNAVCTLYIIHIKVNSVRSLHVTLLFDSDGRKKKCGSTSKRVYKVMDLMNVDIRSLFLCKQRAYCCTHRFSWATNVRKTWRRWKGSFLPACSLVSSFVCAAQALLHQLEHAC